MKYFKITMIMVVIMLFPSCSVVKPFKANDKLGYSITTSDGNFETAKEAIEEGANVNKIKTWAHTKFGTLENNPTSIALDNDFLDIAKYLIEKGSDPNHMGNFGISFLMSYSINGGNLEFCDFLLNHGAKVDLVGKNKYEGFTALECSLLPGYSEVKSYKMFKFLLSRGAKMTPKTIELALQGDYDSKNGYCSYELIQKVLKDYSLTGQIVPISNVLEASILSNSEKVVELINKGDLNKKDEQMVLYYTAAFGNIETMKLLLSKGLDIKSVDALGNTLLAIAAKYNDVDMLKFLYGKAIKPEIKNYNEEDALTLAISNNKLENVKYLINVGVKFQVEPKGKVIEMACLNGNIDMVKFILSNHYPINDYLKYYALQKAILNNQINILRYFMDDNTSPNIKNGDESILEEACLCGNIDAVKFLVEQGADVNGTNKRGGPLKIATQFRKVNIVSYLLKMGANADVIGKYDGTDYDTILTESVRSGSLEIIKMLVEHGADIKFTSSNKKGEKENLKREIEISQSRNIKKYFIEKGANIGVPLY